MRTPELHDVAVGLCLIALCGAAVAQTSSQVPIPANLVPPAGQVQVLTAPAKGVQIYVCSVDDADSGRFKWTFVAPEADLFDAAGKKIGTHYAGPTWEVWDGSKVVGALVAKDEAPDPMAIPWLLLSAKTNSGNGTLTGVQSVQRLQTAGGKAPAAVCDASQAGKTIRSPYTARYNFYAPAGYAQAPKSAPH